MGIYAYINLYTYMIYKRIYICWCIDIHVLVHVVYVYVTYAFMAVYVCMYVCIYIYIYICISRSHWSVPDIPSFSDNILAVVSWLLFGPSRCKMDLSCWNENLSWARTDNKPAAVPDLAISMNWLLSMAWWVPGNLTTFKPFFRCMKKHLLLLICIDPGQYH